MAVVELQFRKQAFLDFFTAELNRQRLPFPTVESGLILAFNPQLKGRPLQRIECVGCTMDPTSGDGQATIQAQVVLHYNNGLPEVKAAGSLKAPVTQQWHSTVPVTLSV